MNEESTTSACVESVEKTICFHVLSTCPLHVPSLPHDTATTMAIALKVQVELKISSKMSMEKMLTVQRLAKEHYALEHVKLLQFNAIDNGVWEMFPLPDFAAKAIDIMSKWNEHINNHACHASAVQRQYDYVLHMTFEQKARESF